VLCADCASCWGELSAEPVPLDNPAMMKNPATAESWKCIPFTEGISLTYAATFNQVEFAQICRGLVPLGMEDKWFIYHQAPFLYLHRSWTGKPYYRLCLDETSEGGRVTEALWAREFADGKDADLVYQVRLLDFLVSNLLLGLGKPFPLPEGHVDEMPGVYQHHLCGTGYPEVTVPTGIRRSKPWWKFW